MIKKFGATMDADNIENERLLRMAQLQKRSGTTDFQNPVSPCVDAQNSYATRDNAACNISESDKSLTKIKKVAAQLVMNSPDKQRILIRPHLRATAPPYESPDSCPPPPNNTPDSGQSNLLKGGCTSSAMTPSPYSTVKVLKPPGNSVPWTGTPVIIPSNTPTSLKPPEKNAHWTVTPVNIPNTTPTTLKPPEKSAHWTVTPVNIPNNTPVETHGLAPPVSSSRWTATPVSVMSSPGDDSVYSPGSNTGGLTGSQPARLPKCNESTSGSGSSSVIAQTSSTEQSSHASLLPKILVTPPGDNSFALPTPDSAFSVDLNRSDIPRLRSDSEGSVSSILSLNSAMLKLIDTSQESISSSVQGVKGSETQSDMNSDIESPKSVSSPLQSNEDGGKKRSKGLEKDMRKKLLQDLMSAEITKQEEKRLKKHNVKLMQTPTPKSKLNPVQKRIRRQPYIQNPEINTCSTPVKSIFLILLLALTSLLAAWIFTDVLGPMQRRILVGDWDSLDAAKEPHTLPWIPENEDVGSIYKYGGVRGVLTQFSTDKNIDTYSETQTSGDADAILETQGLDLGLLDQSISFSDLNRLEETNDDDLESGLEDKFSDGFESAFEVEDAEAIDLIESSDSYVLDHSLDLDEDDLENIKPNVLKLLYFDIINSHGNGDIDMKNYTNMYRYLNSFLTTFGSFAATQSKMLNDRIRTLEKLREHNGNYALASKMFNFETASGLIDNDYPISGSMIFCCLHRHLQYLTKALENIEKLKPNQSLFVAFKAAYDDVLAVYHHWFVEKFYLLGLTTLPTKGNALMRMNDRFVEVSSLAQLSKGFKLIIARLQELTHVTEALLNKHNVTHMIPAQVITR